MLVRVKNSDWHLQFLRNDPYRLCEVGIVGYECSHLELFAESISNEMRCEVHIRSLLFGFLDPDSLKGTPYKWLDLGRLCQALLPSDAIQEIKYFTARVGTVHDETPFGSPWRENGDRLRVTCREKKPEL